MYIRNDLPLFFGAGRILLRCCPDESRDEFSG